MRVSLVALLMAALLHAEPQNLLPREGSGWEGFKTASWVKTKLTFSPEGRVPAVTLTVQRLSKVGEKELTLATETREVIGAARTSESKVPRHGEAGATEKAEPVETLSDEEVTACGKTFLCTRTRTTVKGPDGSRVITEWNAKDPIVRVKRLEKSLDKEGKTVSSYSMLLTSLTEKMSFGTREIACQRYSTLRRTGPQESEGDAIVSREVPGGTVVFEETHRRDGKTLMTIRVDCLDFEAK